MMFSLSFVGGPKSAEGGPNPLDRGGPYPLADLHRGVQIRWDTGHLREKLKRPLTSSRVNHWEITLYSSFFKLVKDIREKSMENNGDEIAVLFPEGHEAIQITY